MKSKILMTLFAMCLSSAASAQEYGLLVGIHQTDAKSDVVGTTTSGVLNFKFGLAMAFELVPNLRFKTGAVYNERHVDVKVTAADTKYGYNFAYIDVPINVQYNFNQMVGVFGGMVVGVNVNDNVKAPTGVVVDKSLIDTKSLIPLVDVGANFMFDDMIGFDLYYEHGLGDAAKDFGKYNTFGLNFIYWF